MDLYLGRYKVVYMGRYKISYGRWATQTTQDAPVSSEPVKASHESSSMAHLKAAPFPVCGDAEGQTACLTPPEIKWKAESDCVQCVASATSFLRLLLLLASPFLTYSLHLKTFNKTSRFPAQLFQDGSA
jgi:hypothetical protein